MATNGTVRSADVETRAQRPNAWPARSRVALVNGSLLLLSLAAASGAGEVAVRVLAPQQLILKRPDVWKAVDTLGWVHRANLRTTINTGERSVHVVTDQDGFRVGGTRHTAVQKHVLLLGDSFMEAFQVEYEESLAGLLEARLPARIGMSVDVANTAVGGWDPPQYLLQARALLGRRRFDLVLVSLYVGNDVVSTRPDRFPPRAPKEVHALRVPRRLVGSEWVDAVLYPINDFLEVRSQLYVFLKTRLHTARMRVHLAADYFPTVLLRTEATAPRWEVTAQICRDIAALADRAGIPTLFVLVPTPYQVDPAAFAQFLRGFQIDSAAIDVDQPSRLLRLALEKQHLTVLDALPAFRVAQSAGMTLYGHVDNHLSPAGHGVLERYLEAGVAAKLRDTTPDDR